MLFGGDEWWFFGPRIYPGDQFHATRMVFDYRVADTRFSGPTAFQRGDTNYFTQDGAPVAIQRSTALRFLVENAQRLGFLEDTDRGRPLDGGQDAGGRGSADRLDSARSRPRSAAPAPRSARTASCRAG